MNKDRTAVLLCSNASGGHKLKSFVIGKYKKPRAFKGLPNFPVIYVCNLMLEWINNFSKTDFLTILFSVKNLFDKLKMSEDSKAILIVANCKAHPEAEELVSGNISITYLPPNSTTLLQPMDQGVIQNIKISPVTGSILFKS